MEEKIEVTKSELIKAYEIWNNEFLENPHDFVEIKNSNPEDQVDYLIEKINQVKNK